MQILVTGANGFVGSHLSSYLPNAIPITRNTFGEITPGKDWMPLLKKGTDTIVHLAARTHKVQDKPSGSLTKYRNTNTSSTLNLARQAASAGVRRFIFLSSIKVNGEGRDSPYTEQDIPMPLDPYALSKWETEQVLLEIAEKTSMEIVILRPPLIYGPGVKANFLRILQCVEKGYPLPFGAINNQRSLLYIDNLIDAIKVCITHPAAANQTFLISDNELTSTTGLIRKLAFHFSQGSRLIPIHPSILRIMLTLGGRKQESKRLLDSLLIDNNKIRRTLNWEPPYTLDQGLRYTVGAYRHA